jgi:replicative DNA helicase
VNLPQHVRDVDRIPPSNLDAEMALLGSILVDREMMANVSEHVRPNDFYAAFHETIYQALFALFERGEPLDKVTLAEELKQRGLLDKVGGLAYLTSLMEAVPTAASAEYYAKIVAEKASLRRLIHAGTQITQIGYEAEEDVDGGLDRAEQIVYEIGQRNLNNQFAKVSNFLVAAFQTIEKKYYQKSDFTGLTSGFRAVDEYTTGFQPGNLIIIAARPSMGKTSIALAMALAAAKREGKPIAFFSLEMTNQELVERLMSAEARLDAHKLRRGKVEDDEWQNLSDSIGRLHDLPIFLDDSGSLSVTELRSRSRRLKSMDGLSCIFVDYLQLIRPSASARQTTRNEELAEICRILKATAKDLEVPVIALAQLNRAVESRPNKRPMLSDLRDSGAIEQEADVVAFLYRDAYYNPESAVDPDVTEFIIAKQRNGPTGTVKLRFVPQHTTYVPYGDERYYPTP